MYPKKDKKLPFSQCLLWIEKNMQLTICFDTKSTKNYKKIHENIFSFSWFNQVYFCFSPCPNLGLDSTFSIYGLRGHLCSYTLPEVAQESRWDSVFSGYFLTLEFSTCRGREMGFSLHKQKTYKTIPFYHGLFSLKHLKVWPRNVFFTVSSDWVALPWKELKLLFFIGWIYLQSIWVYKIITVL